MNGPFTGKGVAKSFVKKSIAVKECLNVRQTSWEPDLTLSQSLIHSLSSYWTTFACMSMLKSHSHTLTHSHSHTISLSQCLTLTLDMLNNFCSSQKLDTFRSYSGISRQTHQYSSEKCPVCFETPCRSTWGAPGSTVQWPRTILDQLEHHWGLLEPDNHQNTTQNDHFWCISGQIFYSKAQNASWKNCDIVWDSVPVAWD